MHAEDFLLCARSLSLFEAMLILKLDDQKACLHLPTGYYYNPFCTMFSFVVHWDQTQDLVLASSLQVKPSGQPTTLLFISRLPF